MLPSVSGEESPGAKIPLVGHALLALGRGRIGWVEMTAGVGVEVSVCSAG